MYIHLGRDSVINQKDIIGIFDLDTSTVSRHTRNYINLAQKRNEIINITSELPKSFIVCSDKKTKQKKVYISQISSVTLEKRSNFLSVTE